MDPRLMAAPIGVGSRGLYGVGAAVGCRVVGLAVGDTEGAADGASVGVEGATVGASVGDSESGGFVGARVTGAAVGVRLQLRIADALTLEPSNASGATYAGSPPSQHSQPVVDCEPVKICLREVGRKVSEGDAPWISA